MNDRSHRELYQQVILEHNRKPKNFGKPETFTHSAEGYNPLCGDHLHVYLNVDDDHHIVDVHFAGDGCAISRASASMMTMALKGKKISDVEILFQEFQQLVKGELHPAQQPHHLGKLAIFSGIWHFPARVKCAILIWHAAKAALDQKESVSTE